jgi:hypothetical protein
VSRNDDTAIGLFVFVFLVAMLARCGWELGGMPWR